MQLTTLLVPTYTQMLKTLSGWLKKGASPATGCGGAGVVIRAAGAGYVSAVDAGSLSPACRRGRRCAG